MAVAASDLGVARALSARSRPVLLGLAGDSASGKTTLARGIEWILGPERVVHVNLDDYHRFDRKRRAELGLTPLDPAANHLDIVAQHLGLLALGESVLKPVYDHSTGEIGPAVLVEPRDVVIVEGLLPFQGRGLRDHFDVKVYLDPEEELRHRWKIQRDCAARGYSIEEVVSELRRREGDAARFVRPQRAFADLVVSFHRQSMVDAHANLGARIVLRPTLSHPALDGLVGTLRRDGYEPVRLFLDRDLGRPAEILEIDGDCPPGVGGEVEEIVWRTMHPDSRLAREQLGRYLHATGKEARSEALALAQLLIVSHVVGALHGALEL
jgi:phosphoribulokinase